MGTGLLVTSLIGASINPTTGDYSRGASGFWVENGEIVRPVNECTIAGNLRRDAGDDPARQRRAPAPLAGRAEPPRRRAGHCRSLTSSCSRPRRPRPAPSRSARVGAPGEVREKPDGRGPVSETDLAVDRMLRAGLLGGAARLRLALGGERGRPRTARGRAGLHRRSDRRDARLPRRPPRPGRSRWRSPRPGRVVAGVVLLPALGRATPPRPARAARATARRSRSRPRRARWRRGAGQRQPVRPAVLAGRRAACRAPLPSVPGLPALPGGRGPLRCGVTFRDTWEWDAAAGDLIVREAGGVVTTRAGDAPVYNRAVPLVDGLLAAGPALHAAIRARI